MKTSRVCLPLLRFFAILPLFLLTLATSTSYSRPPGWEIRDGRFFRDGEWVFLKIAKPLRNFADPATVDQLIADLDLLAKKGYNTFELNCYWHHFDQTGDGKPDVSLEPLRNLISAIYDRGLFPCLSIETYGVGGGQIPDGFWKRHPDAVATNADGRKVNDTEYGTLAVVPSLFSPAYLNASRTFIHELTAGLNHEKLLYFETTVEPQYIGNQYIDYTPHARRAYEHWLAENKIEGPAFPEKFPVPETFREDPTWNRFRAEYLAEWVNRDAAAFREAAGSDAYIAVDYLETCGPEMPRRLGDSRIFLNNLRAADILQVNWHWHVARGEPNFCAYQNVDQVMEETGRNWAVTEHMTLNASDYRPQTAPAMLRNTLERGTRFGWEFVSVSASSEGHFSLYEDDWSPKPLIAVVDENWEAWLSEIRTAAGE